MLQGYKPEVEASKEVKADDVPFELKVYFMKTTPVAVLNVTGNNTIADVKGKIYEQRGTPPEAFRLFCRGKELEDWHRLAAYNIKGHDNVYLAPRLRGGVVPKRARFEDMRVKADDPAEIQAVFGITAFVSDQWLHSLDKETCKSYLEFLDHTKHHERIVQKTVDRDQSSGGLSCVFLSFQVR